MAKDIFKNEEEDETTKHIKRAVKGALLGLFVIVLLVAVFSSFYTVESGQEGVLLTFSKADPVPIGAGLHFKAPFVQSVQMFDMRTQKYGISSLEDGPNGGAGGSLESASSSDLQVVSLQLVVNYHLSQGKSPDMFIAVGPGYEDTVIQPAVHEATKASVAQFNAADLINKREEVRAQIENLLKDKLAQYNIVVEQVSIVNLDFSAQFNAAIENKVTAEQLKQKADKDLERITVEANQVRVAAEGQRDAAIAQATGEAEKVRLVQEQLSKSPQYVAYVQANKWNGVLPQFYESGNGQGIVPVLQINSAAGASSSVATATNAS